MRPVSTAAAALAVVATLFLASPTSAAPGLELKPDRLATLAGKATLLQKHGDNELNVEYDATLVLLTGSSANERTPLLTARVLEDEDGRQGAIEHWTVSRKAGSTVLRPHGPRDFETAGSDENHTLGVFFPLALPLAALPAEGTSARSTESLHVLNVGWATADLVTKVEKSGDQVVVTRELTGGKDTVFSFNGQEATVRAYSERYVLGTDGVIAAIEHHAGFEFSPGGGDPVVLDRTLKLAAKSSVAYTGDSAPAWAELLAKAETIGTSFDTRSASSDELAKVVETFSKSAEDTPVAPLAAAFESRVRAYAQLYESSAEGAALKKVLGRAAPAIQLPDLAGHDYDFAAKRKGKVSILNFWGYG